MEIQHHEKYEELHGEDKIVMMDAGAHKKLHNRLREEGKCNVPPDVLKKISTAAHQRTDKGIAKRAEYRDSGRAKAARAARVEILGEYQQTTLNIDKNLHKRTKLYCYKNATTVNALIVELLADFMKGKRVR